MRPLSEIRTDLEQAEAIAESIDREARARSHLVYRLRQEEREALLKKQAVCEHAFMKAGRVRDNPTWTQWASNQPWLVTYDQWKCRHCEYVMLQALRPPKVGEDGDLQGMDSNMPGFDLLVPA